MSAAVQKYKRVLYSTSTVDEEYKDMLYSGSTDSTGSSTVVARSQTVLCGHSSARLLSTPSASPFAALLLSKGSSVITPQVCAPRNSHQDGVVSHPL